MKPIISLGRIGSETARCIHDLLPSDGSIVEHVPMYTLMIRGCKGVWSRVARASTLVCCLLKDAGRQG